MIEVNLYSIPVDDFNSRVGRCVARNRFDKETMGVTIEEFVKGFLRDNLDKIESKLGMGDLSEIINSEGMLTRRDLSCLNYYLNKVGLKFQIQNVTDDEENPTGIPDGAIEWNIINKNFIQYDYPTAIKILPGLEKDIPAVLREIVENSGAFKDKFEHMKNPFTELLDNLDRIKSVSGAVNSAIVGKIYECLDQIGIEVFCATSED